MPVIASPPIALAGRCEWNVGSAFLFIGNAQRTAQVSRPGGTHVRPQERRRKGSDPRLARDPGKHPDRRDTPGGTLDELPGDRSGEQVKEYRTPHEDAQWGADVHAEPEQRKETMPEGLDLNARGHSTKQRGA